MKLHAKYGSQVRFIGTEGSSYENQLSKEFLKVGQIYTVVKTTVFNSYSIVELVEFPTMAFNASLFEDVFEVIVNPDPVLEFVENKP